jgi:hypothetical protein
LDHNELSSVSFALFDPLDSLFVLDLSYNQLDQLPGDFFKINTTDPVL